MGFFCAKRLKLLTFNFICKTNNFFRICPQIVQSSSASSTSSSSRVAKRVQHTSSSSHLSHQVSELKASSVKSDLSELQSSISEMKNLSSSSSVTTSSSSTQQSNFSSRSAATLAATAGALNGVGDLLRSSMEQLDVDENGDGGDSNEPIITFPEPDTPSTPPPSIGALTSPNLVVNSMALAGTNNSLATSAASEVKFEQKRTTSATKTKMVTDSFSAEQASSNSAEMRRLQTGELTFQQQSNAAAVRSRLEMDGITAEKSAAIKQVGLNTVHIFLPLTFWLRNAFGILFNMGNQSRVFLKNPI